MHQHTKELSLLFVYIFFSGRTADKGAQRWRRWEKYVRVSGARRCRGKDEKNKESRNKGARLGLKPASSWAVSSSHFTPTDLCPSNKLPNKLFPGPTPTPLDSTLTRWFQLSFLDNILTAVSEIKKWKLALQLLCLVERSIAPQNNQRDCWTTESCIILFL